MPSPVTRRRVLAAGAAFGAAALAGCLDGCGPTPPIGGVALPRDGVLVLESSSESALPDGATLVPFAGIATHERSLVRTAVDEGTVAVCLEDDEPGDGGAPDSGTQDGETRADALRSFANRLGDQPYLAVDDDYFGIWLRLTDVLVASTAAPPSDTEDACCEA